MLIKPELSLFIWYVSVFIVRMPYNRARYHIGKEENSFKNSNFHVYSFDRELVKGGLLS